MDTRLYRVVKKMFLYIDGEDGENVHVFKPGEEYTLRFGNFGNGGWPQIYVPKFKDWYDIVLIENENGTLLSDECDEYVYMVLKGE